MGEVELRRLAAERGLLPEGDSAPRGMLEAILRAYDIGAQERAAESEAAAGISSPPGRVGAVLETGGSSPRCCPPDAVVMQQILAAPGPKGVDIGGTLVKMVLALPKAEAAADRNRFPVAFGTTGRTRDDLEISLDLDGAPHVLRFVAGATAQITGAIESLKRRHHSKCQCLGGWGVPLQDACASTAVTTADAAEEVSSLGSFSSASAEEGAFRSEAAGGAAEEGAEVGGAGGSQSIGHASSAGDAEELELQEAEAREGSAPLCELPGRIYTAGGGAHKFAHLFKGDLGIELVPVKELSAVVDGLLFLAAHTGRGSCRSSSDAEGLIFEVGQDGRPSPVPWPEQLFPFYVVNIGSGVSILRVTSAEEGGYERVGGTACGGATFLGLASVLTSARTFEEALKLAEGGDSSFCDLLVKDIYGEEGSVTLGLPGSLTAANFGKLCSHDSGLSRAAEASRSGSPSSRGAAGGYTENDLARGLLQMVTQQSVLLSLAHARRLDGDGMHPVFFAGGFVEEGNHLARATIANSFRNLGGRAYFLRHCDFLGALGSLRSCVKQGVSPPSSPCRRAGLCGARRGVSG